MLSVCRHGVCPQVSILVLSLCQYTMTGFALCRYTVFVLSLCQYTMSGFALCQYTVSCFVSVSAYYDWVYPMSVYRVLVCLCVSILCLGLPYVGMLSLFCLCVSIL